ncbi:hypothetical protein D3C77_720390 [compost metagenome]
MILPPSSTDGVAVRDKPVLSSAPGTSVTVTVVSPDASSFSKLPPLTSLMLLVRSRLLVWTLFGAMSCTVPVV